MTESYSWLGDNLMSETRAFADGTADSRRDHTGTIEYVHGGGMDMPLGMVRNGTGVTLHSTYRGLYAFGTGSNGRKVDEHAAEWPGNNRRAGLGGVDHRHWKWYGQLVASGTDATGLLYRRARYYDPENGQFTQPDPIGQLGGLNVFGFADGDPVNLTDPFGLCVGGLPCPKWLRTTASIGVSYTPIVGDVVDVVGGIARRDLLTGESIGGTERILVIATLIPGVSGAGARGAFRGIKKLSAKDLRNVRIHKAKKVLLGKEAKYFNLSIENGELIATPVRKGERDNIHLGYTLQQLEEEFPRNTGRRRWR